MRHACNAYCRPPEHCDLVLTGEAPLPAGRALITVAYQKALGVLVTHVEPAREAPGLDDLPPDSIMNLTPHLPTHDTHRWLVWWAAA